MSQNIIKPDRGARAERAPEPDGAARVVRKDAYQATLDAHEIVAAAHRQAEAILEDARRQRETVLAAAKEQGYREGLGQWTQTVLSAQAAREETIARHEQDLLRLTVRAAEKIVGQELRTHPDTIASIVRECLRSVRGEQLLTVQVNPEDAEAVRTRTAQLAPPAGPAQRIQVVPDPAVGRGGCIVESEFGIVDARLETQLQCLEEVLLRAARK